ETALNIFKASQGQPVTEKYITVAGDVPNRVTVKVPVGTPIIDVLRLSGIEDFTDYAVIDGGPMMGPVMTDIGGFITKKNKGFVVLKKDHFLIRKKSVTPDQARRVNKATCEQCRMCTDLCPRYLLGHNMQPHKIMRVLNYSI
ncbi:4Fe-4S dicluster domain-containing protein, partial [Intestinibacillus massiliensis]|nr:4Fe-4S dicluster domain-containing protein [Intestinibacillus massiliensis]